MRYIYMILACALITSCKQGLFLKRKYTDGFYFSNSKTLQLKDIHGQKTKDVEFSKAVTAKKLPHEPLTDTIITNSGQRIPCKVKTIERKRITYTNNIVTPTGENRVILNRKVKRIDFNGIQREYFTEINKDGNPLIQKGITDNGQRKNGMAIFGSVMTLLLSLIFLVAIPPVGVVGSLLSIGTLIVISGSPTSSDAYMVFNGIGKFLGILYITAFVVSILAIVLVAALL